MAVSTIAAIVLIFLFIGREAAPVLTSAEVHQEVTVAKMVVPLASRPGQPNAFIWQPVSDTPKYSLLPLLLGTLKATLIAILFAAPFAVGAAIYSSEFAPPRIREVIKPVIEMLAGIPSVVMGFFALMVLASVLKDSFGWKFRLNATNAGIALGVAIIPVIYTVAEGALRAVPRHLREAAQALGATPWETARRVILPAAAPGIFAGVALGLGRAVGETMIVLLASGNAAIWSADLTDSIRTMSATIAAELAEVVNGSAHYHVLFFIGALLFLITFLVNSLGELYIGRLRRRLTGVAG
ncbi:MAG: phosphate ABC transporter permease subunit PstC [candidate division Zixibacteria bacterium]|nr:phosphate ABC transporter permease subunit PstC [candidate division Zixibacteria bacterium]